MPIKRHDYLSYHDFDDVKVILEPANFRTSLQAITPDITHTTSCRNAVNVEHTTSVVFVAISNSFAIEETKNFTRFSLKHMAICPSHD